VPAEGGDLHAAQMRSELLHFNLTGSRTRSQVTNKARSGSANKTDTPIRNLANTAVN